MVYRAASTLSEPHTLCLATRDCILSRSKKIKNVFFHRHNINMSGMNVLFPTAHKLFINVFVIVEIQVWLSKLVKEGKHTELESLYNRILPND